jgi:neutral/alkaline ceramidase-like enzyme
LTASGLFPHLWLVNKHDWLRNLIRRLSPTLFLVLASGAIAAEPSNLQAGVARVNLTPPPEMKAALGGYGARLSKPATGVHDSVWAKALVLAQGQRKFAVVTADALAFPPQFKSAVIKQLANQGWTSEQVMLLPSHSHTSIDMMALHPGNEFGIPQVGIFQKELFVRTANLLAQVVQEAGRNLVPVSVGSATTKVANRNRNRRGSGTTDPDLAVTRIDTYQATPLAVLVNWTAHPTFMDAEDMQFSGDWPGHLQRTLEALIARGVTVMYYNGAEGDQSPVPPPNCGSRWERAEVYGRDMALTAWRTWEKIQPRQEPAFKYHTEVFALPKRQWHRDFMKTGGAEYGLNEAMMPGFVERLVPAQTSSTCLQLGDLLILGVPGEMAAKLGLEAKAKARQLTSARCITIGGLADEWVSYILPATEYERGGYEASMSFYGETLGDTIVEGVVRSAQGLK